MSLVHSYFNTLGSLPLTTLVTGENGNTLDISSAFNILMPRMRETHNRGNKLMFIGNGGSAGICSHMAIDYSKNGGMRSLAFNDGAALTCLGNDYGYENVFSKQIELHARANDMLIAISSSGQSENILRAVHTARKMNCYILTLSGFKASNPLRTLGDINLYVDSSEYGFVEITHLSLCHAILDLEQGWVADDVEEEVEKPKVNKLIKAA